VPKRPNALGRPPTSGTRHGNGGANGRGHGGPAKGAGTPRESLDLAQPGQVLNPHGRKGGYRALARNARLEALKEALWDDAFDPNLLQRDRHAARESLLNREEGLPVARVVTSDDADKWFIEGGRESATVEEWTQTHGLATAKPQGHGDD
jgi:hypothetical protein